MLLTSALPGKIEKSEKNHNNNYFTVTIFLLNNMIRGKFCMFNIEACKSSAILRR